MMDIATAPLPDTHYDAVIVGTGLPESILAAALSIAGASVLHLDPNPFYGSAWCTVPVSKLEPVFAAPLPDTAPPSAASTSPPDAPLPATVHAAIAATLGTTHYTVSGLSPSKSTCTPLCDLFPLGVTPIPTPPPSFSPQLSFNANRTLIDLTPRPVMAAGPLMDLLIRTNVGHYIDFRPVDALYLHRPHPHAMLRVPATRADVFNSAAVSVVDKRRLTRFVKHCLSEPGDDDATNDDTSNFTTSLSTVMTSQQLSPLLQSFLHHAVVFAATAEHPAYRAGVRAVQRFHRALQAFGTQTPFLYPNYGAAELAQAFCRLAAVHGATYVLRRGAVSVAVAAPADSEGAGDTGATKTRMETPTTRLHACDGDGDGDGDIAVITECHDVVAAGRVFVSRHLATRAASPPVMDAAGAAKGVVWRFAGVVEGSVTAEGEPDRVVIAVPCATVPGLAVDVRVRQVDHATGVCEAGTCIVYAETVHTGGTEAGVVAAVREFVRLGDGENEGEGRAEEGGEGREEGRVEQEGVERKCVAKRRPKLLWGMTYARTEGDRPQVPVEGVELVSAPEVEVDADGAVAEAERCFRLMVGNDKEFLPGSTDPGNGTNGAMNGDGNGEGECEGEGEGDGEGKKADAKDGEANAYR